MVPRCARTSRARAPLKLQIIHKSVNWRDPYGFKGRLGDFRETANSSSLMVSNNSRISRLETIMFPRFLKLELDRGSRTPDALEVDEAGCCSHRGTA